MNVYQVKLGGLGRLDNPQGKHVSEEIEKFLPVLERLVADGKIQPVDLEVYERVGWAGLNEAIAFYADGKAKKKIVVNVQPE